MEDCVLAGREVAALIDGQARRGAVWRDETRAPHVSIVIPVYNEEGILHAARCSSCSAKLDALGWSYELCCRENGSRDRTVEIGEELAVEHPQVRMLHARRAELRPGA